MSNYLDFLLDIEKLSVKQLQYAKKHIEQLIIDRLPEDRKFISCLDINDFVDYHPNFIDDYANSVLLKEIQSVKKFNITDDGSNNVKTLWLSRTSQMYEWESTKSGKKSKHNATPIGDFPAVEALLEKLNCDFDYDLNSCLVSYYPNGNSGIRVHDDCESTMDNSQPIAVISLGANRSVEFFHNYQAVTEIAAKSLTVQEKSLYVMKSQCQEYFKHRVPSDKKISGERISLSFRRILTPEACNPASKQAICQDTVSAKSVKEMGTCTEGGLLPTAPYLPISPAGPTSPPLRNNFVPPSAPPLSSSFMRSPVLPSAPSLNGSSAMSTSASHESRS